MPGVIVKSSYMTNRTHIVNYMRYIATREGVEHLTPSVRQRPATARQQTYIAEHLDDMQKLGEYQAYVRVGTIDAASQLITAYSERVVAVSSDYREVARAARELPTGDPERPVTDKQRKFISKHRAEADGLPEWEDFQKSQTVGNASALIGMIAEMNPTDPEIYLRYIAERPGVERGGAPDGLFTLQGKADLAAECDRVLESKSVVWAHIVSLRREDATRLGVDSAEAWRKYLAAEAPKIAQLYHISPANLRLLGAYHDEGHHPHIHMLVYSEDPDEGTITKKQMQQAGQKMRSMFTNSIFREDLAPIKAAKTHARDEISQRIQDYKNMLYGKKVNIDPEIVQAVCALAHDLPATGKKQYAYFSRELKQRVDDLLRLIVRKDPAIGKLAETYFSCERKMIELYHDDQEAVEKKFSETLNHFYEPRTGKFAKDTDRTAMHNSVIRWAYAIRAEQYHPEATAPAARAEPPPQNSTLEWEAPEVLPVKQIPEDAIKKIIDMADRGNPAAQYRLAGMLRDGTGVRADDHASDGYFYRAYRSYLAAAENGNPDAHYRVAVMWKRGEGVPADKKKATRYLRDAAYLGHAQSMYLLGEQLIKSPSIKQYGEGCDYIERAAQKGHLGATYMLGKLYFDIEDPEMKEAGVELLREAAARGYQPAGRFLEQVGRENPQYAVPVERAQPEVLPVAPSSVGGEQTAETRDAAQAASTPRPPEEPEGPPKSASTEPGAEGATPPSGEAEGLPVDEEPEIDASGGDIFPDDRIPLIVGESGPGGEADTAPSKKQSAENRQQTAGASVQYLVLLMLRELAGSIEARCNTDDAFSRMKRRHMKGQRHNRHQPHTKTYEEAPYEN